MKKYLLIPMMFILSSNSCKNENLVPAKIVRDCTGTYIRMDSKDYMVCNIDKLESFKDGADVQVAYSKITNCAEANNRAVCLMYHQNEGWVEVSDVE